MTIIFCIPGKSFSARFLVSWTQTLVNLRHQGMEVFLRTKYTSNVYHCRNLILNDKEAGSRSQTKPFPDVKYDYLMWIDSDMVWNPDDIIKLLQAKKDIITGLAITEPIKSRLNCGKTDMETGKCNFFYNIDLPNLPRTHDGLIECDFAGYGFLLVKYGVFEAMMYPWFRPMYIKNGKHIYFPSEDITWSLYAKEFGYKIYADPEVRIGHEKSAILKVRASGEGILAEPAEV